MTIHDKKISTGTPHSSPHKFRISEIIQYIITKTNNKSELLKTVYVVRKLFIIGNY